MIKENMENFIGRFNKKANVFNDSIVYIVGIFIIILVMIFGIKLFHSINPILQTTDTINADSKTFLNKMDNNLPTLFNNMILMTIILLWIATIIFSFVIDTHPVFFIIGFFLLMISLIVGLLLGNVYNNLMENQGISDTASQLSIATWFFSNMHIVMVLVGMSILIALYVKSQYNGGTF